MASGYAWESARRLPVAARVDVAVIGGSTWAVRAAISAAARGASVLVVTRRHYLGEDLCATLRLRCESPQADELGRALFPAGPETTPLRIKQTLDRAVLGAGVDVLYGCYATEAVRDAEGRISGIAIGNRAGRQVVLARCIIDATERAWFARLAGAKARPWPVGPVAAVHTVIAGAPEGTRQHEVELRVRDGRFASLCEAEHEARDTTHVTGLLRAAEDLFMVPPDPIICRAHAGSELSGRRPALDHFRPVATDHVYVLSGCADITRAEVERLLAPCGLLPIAADVGAAAADDAAARAPIQAPFVARSDEGSSVAGDVCDALGGIRDNGDVDAWVPSDGGSIQVLGRYDVLVVGGGTAGACAAIGAARQGASVLVAEFHEGLGGIGTLGLIGHPYHGRNEGFAKEVPFPVDGVTVQDKMEWYRREIRSRGGRIWFGTLGCGAFVSDGRVVGAVIATPEGRGVVLAGAVVDATSSADIAVAAGAATMHGATDDGLIALQGTGLPARPLERQYVNSDYLFADENDMIDVRAALIGARMAIAPEHFDVGSLIQSRERRRIVGDHILCYLDQITGRTYADGVVCSSSDYDSHGYPTHPYFALMPHDDQTRVANHPAPGGVCYTPYRCLLPRGLDGVLVTGLAISMERDASALVRMQHDLHNQGYAVGVAAAMAGSAGCGVRSVDVRSLQEHLVQVGSLPGDVLAHTDAGWSPSPGRSAESARQALVEAVDAMQDARQPVAALALARVMADPAAALPIVRDAYTQAEGVAKLCYAKLLGVWGVGDGVPLLIDALAAVRDWDEKILQGRMAEYAHLPTPVDGLILALGCSRDARALPGLLEKCSMLTAATTLSHHRAIALALERLASPEGAVPLRDVLSKRGIAGHVMSAIEPLFDADIPKRRREGSLREIMLARALYRCGDVDGVGEAILRGYLRDVRGLFSRHAAMVLASDASGHASSL